MESAFRLGMHSFFYIYYNGWAIIWHTARVTLQYDN